MSHIRVKRRDTQGAYDMLILTRRPVEAINIGDEIVLTVLGVTGGQVRFGIDAPRSIPIDRAEVFERKRLRLAEEVSGNVALPPSQRRGDGD
jgi:carbon storage regulator